MYEVILSILGQKYVLALSRGWYAGLCIVGAISVVAIAL